MPFPSAYATASLLDRLIDLKPRSDYEPIPLRVQTRKAFHASLHRDLEWLLNTRCPVSETELAQRERSVIDYGRVDFGTFYINNPDDYGRLKQNFEEIITYYEPRLTEICVTITPKPHSHSQLLGLLEARLIVDDVDEQVSFPIVIDIKHGCGVKFISDE
ncbi:MAG TPA: type VI secretion system baseplate subunit TssE [Thioploca sp.]|nr:MAG: type VI secretion system baseplate subunit TssE [Gammaproteobacteria bacterium]HDN27471.1 type VI secretion system baseplate subunit TssE [Thioploca sp.]